MRSLTPNEAREMVLEGQRNGNWVMQGNKIQGLTYALNKEHKAEIARIRAALADSFFARTEKLADL